MRLSYVLGLRGLGCDVGLVEEIERAEPAAVDYFRATIERYGLTDSSALVDAVRRPGRRNARAARRSTRQRERQRARRVAPRSASRPRPMSMSIPAMRRSGTRPARSRSRRTTSTSRSRRTLGVPGALSRQPGSSGDDQTAGCARRVARRGRLGRRFDGRHLARAVRTRRARWDDLRAQAGRVPEVLPSPTTLRTRVRARARHPPRRASRPPGAPRQRLAPRRPAGGGG